MTRIAPRRLDYDENLPMAFKWIKDALAELIKPGMAVGRADDDKRFRFEFDQRKGEPKEYAIEIEIENIFLVRNIDLDHEDFKKSMEKCKVIICNNHEGKSC